MHLIGKVKAFSAMAALLLMPLAATGEPLRSDDRERLAALDASLGRALRAAFAGGGADELALLRDGLRGTAMAPEAAMELLPGDWNCRMIKLGRNLPIVVYQPFRCRADGDGGFEKLTGSQRTRGALHLVEGQLLYLGTGFVAGEEPPDYAELPEAVEPYSVPQFMPEIGLVEMVSETAGRIIFPQPHLESETNLLVLTRD